MNEKQAQDSRPQEADPSDEDRWPLRQRERAIELLESVAWLDIDLDLKLVGKSLGLGMEATRGDFNFWRDEHAAKSKFGDDLWLKPEQVEAISDEWRYAYVARLLRTAALVLGAETDEVDRGMTLGDFAGADISSAGGLVRALVQLAGDAYESKGGVAATWLSDTSPTEEGE